MDSFEINKIIAAVLVVFLVVFGIGKISDIVFHVEKPNTSAYKVEVSTASSKEDSGAVQLVDIAALLAMGDLDHGKKIWKNAGRGKSTIRRNWRNTTSTHILRVQ